MSMDFGAVILLYAANWLEGGQIVSIRLMLQSTSALMRLARNWIST